MRCRSLERVISACIAACGGQGGDARVGACQRGLAQIQLGGNRSTVPLDDAFGIARLDFALHA